MVWLLGIAVLLLLAGWFARRRGDTAQEEAGLPAGRLIYADTHAQDWTEVTQPLYSARYRLAGKPDYLVETPSGVVPVEVKSSAAPQVPYLGHLLQLAAYCLLVEESTGRRPSHGLLKYADALFEVDYTAELRAELLHTLAEIRAARRADEVPRNHDNPAKCARCGVAYACDEALA